jgi:hypothetical protein
MLSLLHKGAQVADARRPQRPPQPRALVDPRPEDDGWRQVAPKKKRKVWSRVVLDPPPRPRKVSADLVGLCFNCFTEDHIACDCPNPSCCFRCREPGHQAQDCRQPRAAPFGRSTGRVGRSLGRGSHRGGQVEPRHPPPPGHGHASGRGLR